MRSDKPTLWYFDIAGIAEPIRFVFLLGNVPFQEQRLSGGESWESSWKSQFPTGKLPCLEVDGFKYCESRPILLYAATKAKIIPQHSDDLIKAQLLEGLVFEQCFPAYIDAYRAKQGGLDMSIQKEEIRKRLLQLDSAIAETQDCEGHCVGGTVSYIDALVATQVIHIENLFSAEEQQVVCAQIPHVMKTRALIYKDSRIQQYLMDHPTTCKLTMEPDCWKGDILATLLRLANIDFTTASPAEKENHGLLPSLTLNKNYTIAGLRAIVTWMNRKLPLFTYSTEGTCKIWGLVDLIGGVWEQILANDALPKAITDKIKLINDMLIREQSVIGTFAGQRFTLADVAAACFYAFISHSTQAPVIDGTDVCAFRQSYRLVSVAPNFTLSRWKGCPNVPKLYYFNLPGRAEPIRLLLHVAGMKFEDIRFDKTSVQQYTALSPLSKWPILRLGETTYFEAIAILKLVAEWTQMTPVTVHGRAVSETIASLMQDYEKTLSRAKGEEERTKALKLVEDEGAQLLDEIEKCMLHFKVSGKYVVEKRFTWIDFLLGGSMIFSFTPKLVDMKDRWPRVLEVYENVNTHPAVTAYKASLGPPMVW